ncbi:hypothetical protein K493DRAFT_226384 [Basidiobolus meristosporus CBS 931.73]|uniref:EI24-domain-containing protein n=1 Tax=Basidiobolus meristosporus CBS 931.73 TaxID=1314790 RepID=A0A1Y1Y2C2_9FUNG|nr:hypothetical protein K493DRAFT_226384 [Basidiobolus meristosporus CBS 931.73]|eukprot:ORX92140.1 hypothetical protein K493DRAFT_226384 [Basidiobolus meristosporus CBS 931.73]
MFFDIIKGFELACEGSVASFRNPQLRVWLLWSFLILFGFLVVVYFVTHNLILFPLKLVKWGNLFFGYLFRYDYSTVDSTLNTVMLSVSSAISTTPFIGLLFVRYLYPQPFDRVFMTSLQASSYTYFVRLSRVPYRYTYWKEMKRYFARTTRRLRLLLTVYALSLLPVIGVLATPLASAWLTSRAFGKPVGYTFALATFIFPVLKPYSVYALSYFYGCRALAWELLEPYFSRVVVTNSERYLWFSPRQTVTLSFAILFYSLMYVPYIGPFFFVLGQASVPSLLIYLSDPPEMTVDQQKASAQLHEKHQ